jgi:hypothetical protein
MKSQLVFEHAVKWAALMVAFFFLIRIGEYAWSGGWDLEKVLAGADLSPKKKGEPCVRLAEADEVMLWFKSSKADQLKYGTARNHFRSGAELCVVEALQWLQTFAPEHFEGSEKHLPLFRFADGTHLTKQMVGEILEQASIEVGMDLTRFRSHSLRCGGATALYHVKLDMEYINGLGR